MGKGEVFAEAAGTGIGASLAATISLLTGRAAETLGLSQLTGLLHALIIGLYAVIFSGIIYLTLKERLRPRSPLLRLWVNTFLFCVLIVLLNSQFNWLTTWVLKAVSSWPYTEGVYLSLGTPTGALLYFLTPLLAAVAESLIILFKEREGWQFPALRRVAKIFYGS